MLKTDSPNVIRSFNMGLAVSTLLIFLTGLVTLYSASRGPGLQSLAKLQGIYFIAGCIITLMIVFIDSDFWRKLAYPTYVVCLGLLTLVLLVGHVGNGSQRWISLGFFKLQPSEFAKIAIVLALAKYFSEDKAGAPYTLKRLLGPALMIIPYFILIKRQPDMGTAGIVFLTAASMIMFIGVEWKSIFLVLVVALISLPLAYKYVLHDYQRNRVRTFLDPSSDPRATGYNALQCRIAVGSGKFLGKGYMEGTQAQLNFIPEQHTDFIFSVFAEERGFLGALVLLGFYASYLVYSFRTVLRARDKFEMLVAFGLNAVMFWHIFINIGMVIGVLPIVGVTLPLFSYGGSSMMMFMICTALLLNISRKKYIF
ncbi:MAG: rod shape-determining protein RodA [Proteobacteria bacterium]|nr:rod shape-determining protein RodA [Pseudomonadota bacterium]NDC23001.1 rod shape-determining protein RodA [Pseudomonadota bacterium]NDD03337.1 rod shape-determining protein RodA [Pseudomonadota bacterium]NDG25862.1 rod shape-determining protein RodA [Pseudomonadota bacterium]